MKQRINTLLWGAAHGKQRVCRDVALAELLGSPPNLEGFTARTLRWRSSERIPSLLAGVTIHRGDAVVILNQSPFDLQELEMNMEGCASIVEQFTGAIGCKWNWFENWCRWSIYAWTIANCQKDFVRSKDPASYTAEIVIDVDRVNNGERLTIMRQALGRYQRIVVSFVLVLPETNDACL
ncbi:hypothetical protein EDD85DRAFT_786477 [Armillaria nabsnona]|nr:hypothetical protein EDD85DRAFT_786477 [Armillaria nabsnona]